jgi:hypothetical protein
MRLNKSLLLLVSICLALAANSNGAYAEQVMDLYRQIKNLSLDEQTAARVENLVLKRDVAVFRLNSGKLCFLEPVEGRITGAVFVGDGVFEFSPPTEIERHQLKKFRGQEQLVEEFEELYLAFSDTTAAELKRGADLSKGEMIGRFESMRQDCPKRLLDRTGRNLWFRILADIIADSSFRESHPERSDRFFYAEVNTNSLGRLFFTFDPKSVEEVTLEEPTGHMESPKCDLVCSFHMENDYAQNPDAVYTPIPREDKDEIRVSHYKIDVDIDQLEHLSAVAEVEYECLVEGARLIDFLLTSKLADNIDEIKDPDGSPVAFFWEKGQWSTTVVLPEPAHSGEKRKLAFKYEGNIIDQNWYGDFYIKSTTSWYPRYGFLKPATFDLTFKCPKAQEFISIGKKAKERIDGDCLLTRWVVDQPVRWASFNYGKFKIHELEHPGVPPVALYYMEDTDRQFTADWNRFQAQFEGTDILLLDSKSKENICADLVNSLNFFQGIYGECPFRTIAAAEILGSFGMGLPGLVYLDWGTFFEEGGIPETEFDHASFRAHEVSHQWWGNSIGCESYHDLWLSEGFAEYSGAWFAQMSMKNNEEFFEELEEWRKDIMGKGHRWSEGSKAGPIWLGSRLNSSKSRDYSTLVYKKGAYILHMLRNMMMDFDSGSDDRFREMMGEFARTYAGKNATTEDFKAVVEKHTEEDMDWFFEQWVYGVEIPKYVFSYSTEKVADKYVVSCEVSQENVSEDFKMWVPVLLDFGGEMYAVLRLWVDKPHNKYKLPKAPLAPRKVELNPFHAVLCEVENK